MAIWNQLRENYCLRRPNRSVRKMLWMETYLFYYTVRLGVIVIGTFTYFQLFIPAILLFAFGVNIFEPIIRLFENDANYKNNVLVEKILDWVENDGQTVLILLQCYLFVHMFACVLLVYGAFKLQKWCLVPFSVVEFVRVIYCLTWHIVLMIMLKKLLNLGVLIAYTLAGGFLILYLGYNWAASVALFQIITLIKSDRYKRLYGEDPFRPTARASAQSGLFSRGTLENVHVLKTPNSHEVDELKHKNAIRSQGVISVEPFIAPTTPTTGTATAINKDRYIAGNQPVILGATQQTRWWHQAPQADLVNAKHHDKENALDNDNWQWSELLGANHVNQRTKHFTKY